MPSPPTYTFSGDNTDPKDEIRMLIGDTNPDGKGFLLSDEQVLYAIATEGRRFWGAAACCEMIAALYTGPLRSLMSRRIGDLQIVSGLRRTDPAEDWRNAAQMFRKRIGRRAVPVAGGLSRQEEIDDAADTDLKQPQFLKGMDDYIGNLTPPGTVGST